MKFKLLFAFAGERGGILTFRILHSCANKIELVGSLGPAGMNIRTYGRPHAIER